MQEQKDKQQRSTTVMNRQEFRFSSVQRFVSEQKVLDMNLTLGDLADRIGSEMDAVAGYVFVWDKYIYDVGLTLPRDPVISRGAIRARSQGVLDLNTRLADLQALVSASDIDKVAGYIYTEDKKTFIVASAIDGMGLEAFG